MDSPSDLSFNRGLIEDPPAFAEAALDQLPRPTLVTCRTGPRSSALVHLYAGLKQGASASEVLERAREDEAPFAGNESLESWVGRGLEELA